MRHYTGASVLSTDPRVVVVDGFVTASEAAELVASAERIGFDPSGSGCGGNRRVCSMSYVQCFERPACAADVALRRLEERMIELLGVPAESCESLGIFRYSPGQAFFPHHDQSKSVEVGVPGGPRAWAAYVFLNDVPGGGGAFKLPHLNISIEKIKNP